MHPADTASLHPADRFALLMQALLQAVAARGPVIGGAVVLIHARLGRLAALVARLAERVRDGRATPTRTDRRANGRQARPAAPIDWTAAVPNRLASLLPRSVGWLRQVTPMADAIGSQLRHLLDDPETKALVAAAPPMAGALRALCRIIGVDPAHLLPPPSPRRRPAMPPAATAETTAGRTHGAPPLPTPPPSRSAPAGPAFANPPAANPPPANPPLANPPLASPLLTNPPAADPMGTEPAAGCRTGDSGGAAADRRGPPCPAPLPAGVRARAAPG